MLFGLMTVVGLMTSLSGQMAGVSGGQATRVGLPALSESEARAYLAGEGMGLARAAEQNGYPGPRHVLDLGEALGLSAGQRRDVQAVFDAMQREARALGARYVAQDRALADAFAQGELTDERLRHLVGELAQVQGEIRRTHLQAHLKTKPLLSPDQVAMYAKLRGHAEPAPPPPPHH